ncbi:hypothetical protein Vadar_009707 [Vaccinium darrowii]|uniref:Uncharacterized protein n=1 Tax=Vaccinium darrowii TaxID=229202 RepID=A0ACB7YV88_9ERIC|nr:hypothetical protein Vadar_009707 [Vaccinium darrowii]
MNRREDVGRRLYEACLSGSVPALDSLIEEDQFILDRVGSLTGFFNETPLHLAALRGHLDFTKAILTRKPTLASELDSVRCSPLHLASTEGHVKVVQELLRVNTDVCIARDQDGRIPLHLAVMKGRAEVIRKLLGAKPKSIQETLDREETVLHLCVKYNRLEALKTLVQYVQSNGMESLLNSKDTDGNTILHLAAALKQMDTIGTLNVQTIEYLLGIESVKDHANARNQNGSTALDVVDHCPNRDLKTMEIREFLLQAGVRRSICGGPYPNPESPPNNPPRPRRCCKPGVILIRCISSFWTNYLRVDPVWLQEVRGHLITAAALTATVAYQSILSPPGGFWQDSHGGGTPGHAILDSDDNIIAAWYARYIVVNSIGLAASLSTIMLAMTGFPIQNKLLTWLMIFTVYITISCMAYAYVLAMDLVCPVVWLKFKLPSDILFGLVFGWMGLCLLVLMLHSCRFLVWLGSKLVKLVKACYGCCVPRTTHNNITTTGVNPAGRP